MKLTWIFALILLNQQAPATDSLTISHENEPIVKVNRSDFTHPLQDFPLINPAKFDELSVQLAGHVRKAPADAVLDEYGRIIPEKPGIELNIEAFRSEFYSFFFGTGPSGIDLPVKPVYPRIDSELLSNIRTQLIGHYVTYFNSGNKERSHNISLAADAINNRVVFPGETFSFNQTVGIRTKSKGYLPAPIIVRGELSEGIGGGICQVSSTLFNAVDRSGMKIIKRYSHSKRVPYVPPGRDATVSWYGPDFTFKNLYNQPVLIRTKARSGIMSVMLYSSEDINFQPRKVPSSRLHPYPEAAQAKES